MASDQRLEQLDRLVGDWETTLTQLDADGTEGTTSKASDIYRWSANGKFVLHDVDADLGGERLQSMEIIALDPNGSGYSTRSYDPDGSFSDFAATLTGIRWQIRGERQRFDGSFSEDGNTLTGRWEQNEGGAWSPLMTVVLRRRR